MLRAPRAVPAAAAEQCPGKSHVLGLQLGDGSQQPGKFLPVPEPLLTSEINGKGRLLPEANQQALCLWPLPALDGLEPALDHQGWFGVGQSPQLIEWGGRGQETDQILTGVASQPGAHSHLQQSKEKHIRLCREQGHKRGRTPAQAGLSSAPHPQESWGRGAAWLQEAELDPWEEPAGNAGNQPAGLGHSPHPHLCLGGLQPKSPEHPSVQAQLVESVTRAKPDVPGSGKCRGF